MLRFCSLGSGSEGNALVVEASAGLFTTRVLVDNGFGPRELARRLARVGLALDDLDALVFTHEHSDHIGGARVLLRKRRIAVFASRGTASAAEIDTETLHVLSHDHPCAIGELSVLPFAVPHDAAEPLQFVFSDGDARLGLLTDIGAPTAEVIAVLGGVDGLILECNHDAQMLAGSDYPAFLKVRIAGDHGHLSNDQAAELLGALDRSRLHVLAAAHLSRKNNRPKLARQAMASVMGSDEDEILVATQDEGLHWTAL